jgi:uncharacterized metal-binding protein YceD (DUF177 family)
MGLPVRPWAEPIAVEDIPDSGLHMDIEAPAAVLTGIASVAGVRDLRAFSAAFDLVRKGAGVHVSGGVSARVGQICVVTLEPIENTVEEHIDLLFAPVAERSGKLQDEGPEPLVGGVLDLGALATEFLLLGIDPYPRKSGAEFAPPKIEDGGEHPFAALATLKKSLGGGQS